uniref:RRM domain-containing protein n=1 Tax=Globisporangium ultimum (strain ATCC 200006 / CBS 805.95 / DAOM BR144) TaxID=431595 RepID=K3WZ46_GLOUD
MAQTRAPHGAFKKRDLPPATPADNEDGAKSSRLFVQNLPAYVDSARLRDHFATQGEVTDAVVIRTKDSKTSRRFGFVGYKTPEQAQKACAFYHQSFLDTCKINVRFAIQRESEEMARPWSKYSVGSSRFQSSADFKGKQPKDAESTDMEQGEELKQQKSKKKATGPMDENSEEFQQFMETMQARSKTRFWANDDVQGPEAQAKAEAAALLKNDSDDDEDDEYQELEQRDESENKKEMSDLDFLRSKVSKSIDKDDDASGSGSEKEYAENIEDDDDDDDESTKEKNSTGDGANADDGDEGKPTARLFVRNLPFTAVEEDLTDLFSAHGEILEVHMPLDDTKRRKGFGFVLFKNTVDAQAALSALNGFAFQGRLLHVIFAKMKPEKVDPEQLLQNPNLTYKQKKELERQITANKQTGWNASFIRGDATVGSLAQRMGVKRGDIMDKENGNMAVRLAIGETMLVKENKDFFAQEGVDLNAIEGAIVKSSQQTAAQKQKIERSTTVILVKNLPHTTDEDELAQLFRKHGEIGRFLVPPSKTLALVEFFEPTEARKAFRSLAYKKYQHVPLYLEWAPVKVFNKDAIKSTKIDAKGIKSTAIVPDVNDDENAADANNTICVKNLSFATKEQGLEKLFKQCGKLRKVTIARRKDPKRGMLSMGFGFVEFVDPKHVEAAIKSLQSTVLDGHALNLKISQKKMTQAPKRKAGDDDDAKMSGRKSKIIVRNVAFEATSNEIRELFAAFGQLKRVRMPKKFDGKHRGFAFVEFLTEQEAQTAFSALSSSHLYGRHLVLEWAEDADDIDTLRAKASKDLSAINDSGRRKRMKRGQDDDDEGDDDDEY